MLVIHGGDIPILIKFQMVWKIINILALHSPSVCEKCNLLLSMDLQRGILKKKNAVAKEIKAKISAYYHPLNP